MLYSEANEVQCNEAGEENYDKANEMLCGESDGMSRESTCSRWRPRGFPPR